MARNETNSDSNKSNPKSAESPEEKDCLLEELPDDIRAELDRLIDSQNGEEIQVSLSTDMKLDGSYGKEWLLVTDKDLLTFSQDGAEADPSPVSQEPCEGSKPSQGYPKYGTEATPFPTFQMSLKAIASVELRDLFGNNILKVISDNHGFEVARFSKTLASKFGRALPKIQELVKASKPDSSSEETTEDGAGDGKFRDDQKQRCPKCNRAIPHWTDTCPACLEKKKLILKLFAYVLPYWRISVLGLTIMLAVTFISLVPNLLVGILIDDVLVGSKAGAVLTIAERTGKLLFLVSILLIINVSATGLSALRGYMMAWLGQKITLNMRNQVYEHLQLLSLSFYSQKQTGNIMARIMADVGRLQDFITEGLQDMIRDSLTIVMICGILFYKNLWLAALALLPTPLLVLLTFVFGRKLHRVFNKLWRRWANMSTVLADTLPGIRVVKAFGQEDREVNRFNEKSEQLFDGEMSAAKLWTTFGPIMGFTTFIGTVIIWSFGGYQVIQGALTTGDLVVFMAFMMRFYGPVQSLCRLNQRFQRAATSAKRVFEILDTEPEIKDTTSAIKMPKIEGRVQFRAVTFTYEEDKPPALKNVSFEAEPGEMIGLAGHSGAGKTTLINLLCRFYDVNEGAILIDGNDIRDIALECLREQIGVVLQDPFLFNGTVMENIAYGVPNAAMKQIVAAAKSANAHDFIMDFPDAYDTQVGERGARVSSGERQRISIARAILKDPRILILDEATSSIDTETEAQIQEALARLIQGRTTFAIAHRLSTLKHANRLIILEKSELKEIGSHEELIAEDGIYAKLCKMQTELSRIRAW